MVHDKGPGQCIATRAFVCHHDTKAHTAPLSRMTPPLQQKPVRKVSLNLVTNHFALANNMKESDLSEIYLQSEQSLFSWPNRAAQVISLQNSNVHSAALIWHGSHCVCQFKYLALQNTTLSSHFAFTLLSEPLAAVREIPNQTFLPNVTSGCRNFHTMNEVKIWLVCQIGLLPGQLSIWYSWRAKTVSSAKCSMQAFFGRIHSVTVLLRCQKQEGQCEK